MILLSSAPVNPLHRLRPPDRHDRERGLAALASPGPPAPAPARTRGVAFRDRHGSEGGGSGPTVGDAGRLDFGQSERDSCRKRGGRDLGYGGQSARITGDPRGPGTHHSGRKHQLLDRTFGRTLALEPWGELIVISPTDRYEFKAFAQGGTLARIVRRSHEPRSPTDAHLQERTLGRGGSPTRPGIPPFSSRAGTLGSGDYECGTLARIVRRETSRAGAGLRCWEHLPA